MFTYFMVTAALGLGLWRFHGLRLTISTIALRTEELLKGGATCVYLLRVAEPLEPSGGIPPGADIIYYPAVLTENKNLHLLYIKSDEVVIEYFRRTKHKYVRIIKLTDIANCTAFNDEGYSVDIDGHNYWVIGQNVTDVAAIRSANRFMPSIYQSSVWWFSGSLTRPDEGQDDSTEAAWLRDNRDGLLRELGMDMMSRGTSDDA